jgi:serine/threonine protein kinase
MASCPITKVGHFEILELVGRGAMGAVYRAVDPILNRVVAIKVIRLTSCDDAGEAAFLKERLFKEARAAGGLSHPGIVTIHQFGTHDDEASIVMEYIDGSTLESRLAAGPPMNASFRRRILTDVAAALDYAHEHGIVHRDIKPANIMLTAPSDGCPSTVKITDFGIAKILAGQTATQTGMVLGTPSYMSPEQICGRALDGRSDQWALGVIAYQMMTGRKPFEGEQTASLCYQIVHADPPPFDAVNSELTSAAYQVLAQALHKDPTKRFPTCMEFVAALTHAFNGQVAPQTTAESPPRRDSTIPMRAAWTRKAPNGLIAILITAACMALIGFYAWSLRPRINQKASQDGSPPVVIPRAEAPAVTASDGRIIWVGRATRGTLLYLEDGRASTGTVYGTLPGEPVELRILPAERSSDRLTVFTADEKYATPVNETTAAGLAAFSWDPRHIMDLTLWEPPGPANDWRRVVLRVNNAEVTACVVEWTRKAK